MVDGKAATMRLGSCRIWKGGNLLLDQRRWLIVDETHGVDKGIHNGILIIQLLLLLLLLLLVLVKQDLVYLFLEDLADPTNRYQRHYFI